VIAEIIQFNSCAQTFCKFHLYGSVFVIMNVCFTPRHRSILGVGSRIVEKPENQLLVMGKTEMLIT
jgi:hypothetical protein